MVPTPPPPLVYQMPCGNHEGQAQFTAARRLLKIGLANLPKDSAVTKPTKAHPHIRFAPDLQLTSFSLFCRYSPRIFSMRSLPAPLVGLCSEPACISELEQKTLWGGLLPVLEETEFSITALRREEAETFWLLRTGLAAPGRQIKCWNKSCYMRINHHWYKLVPLCQQPHLGIVFSKHNKPRQFEACTLRGECHGGQG